MLCNSYQLYMKRLSIVSLSLLHVGCYTEYISTALHGIESARVVSVSM